MKFQLVECNTPIYADLLNIILNISKLHIIGIGCSLLSASGFSAVMDAIVGPKVILLGLLSAGTSIGAVLLQQIEYFLINELAFLDAFS